MFLCDAVKYEPVREKLFSREIGCYESFGIRGSDKSGAEIFFCSDISADMAFVIDLCEVCNRLQISPVHMLDIIEDSI